MIGWQLFVCTTLVVISCFFCDDAVVEDNLSPKAGQTTNNANNNANKSPKGKGKKETKEPIVSLTPDEEIAKDLKASFSYMVQGIVSIRLY